MTTSLFRFFVVFTVALSITGMGLLARSQPTRPEITNLRANSVFERLSMGAALVSGPRGDDVILWEAGRLSQLSETLSAVGSHPIDLSAVNSPNAVALGRDNRIFAAWQNRIQIFRSSGSQVRSFPIPLSHSIVTLPSGDFAVASPTTRGLIHVYSPLGAQRAHIGEMKSLDPHPNENQFLNRGIVLSGPDGGFFYVFTHSPTPSVLQFGPNGGLVREFGLEGASLSGHLQEARSFLATRRPEDVGGFELISSAHFAPRRRTLLVATGARQQGWESIYEYSTDGAKIGEYSLSAANGEDIGRVADLSVSGDRLTVLDRDGRVHSFSLPSRHLLAGPIQAVRIAAGYLGRAADSIFPVAAAAAPCTSYLSSVDCATNVCSVGGARDCEAAMCAQANCNVITSNSCQNSALNCQYGIQTCTNDSEGNAVYINHGPVALTCPKDDDGDGYSDMQAPEDCDDGNYDINPGVSIGSCEQEWPGDYNCNNVPDSEECMTPIVVDMNGDGFALTTKPGGVMFDLVGSGIPKQIPWTTQSTDDAWLAMDRNGNDKIDSGKELWGAPTDQPPSHSRNGYIALAEFDLPKNGGNDDGIIDRRDAVFLRLLLWRDENHDGVSQTSELSRLLESTLRSIDLDYVESPEVDDFGNWLRYQSTATVRAPRLAQRRTCDVYLWAQ